MESLLSRHHVPIATQSQYLQVNIERRSMFTSGAVTIFTYSIIHTYYLGAIGTTLRTDLQGHHIFRCLTLHFFNIPVWNPDIRVVILSSRGAGLMSGHVLSSSIFS